MGTVEKINFPYFINKIDVPKEDRIIIFFGTDFYNLPTDSNKENYIITTNKILDYIRKHFSQFKLIYQAHPNEKEEFKHLDLSGFTIGERKVAEVFLYENANKIEYCFSTCSWASGSAFSMGINSAVFLNLLKGSLSQESIEGYHSYFEGLPKEFFINDFDGLPPVQNHLAKKGEDDGFKKIIASVGDYKKVWVLATDPALALRGAILGKYLKVQNADMKISLLLISSNRWANIKEGQHLFDIFDEVIEIPRGRVIYSLRLKKIWNALNVSFKMRKIPLKDNDVLISFSNLLFEENCLLSYYKKIKKILFIESRWYFFIYGEQYKKFPNKSFRVSLGQRFFSGFLEPILGLYRTIYKELGDGKVINIFRYKKPLDHIYDKTFVMIPDRLSN